VPRALAQAVALAISIDQEARPADALSFGETLRNGAHGIAPARGPAGATAATSATRMMTNRDDPTGATRVAAPRTTRQPASGATPARPARGIEPQPYPATSGYAREQKYDRAAERRGRERRAGRRFAKFLALLCLFAAAVIIAVVIATSTSNTAVQVRRTVANDVNSAINQVQSLIGQYTK